MVLFRHLSLRERWARYRPTRGQIVMIAAVFFAVLLVLDELSGGRAQRAVSLARDELAVAKCVEQLARAADSVARRQNLRIQCAARVRDEP